jgi:hypothetical protein
LQALIYGDENVKRAGQEADPLPEKAAHGVSNKMPPPAGEQI